MPFQVASSTLSRVNSRGAVVTAGLLVDLVLVEHDVHHLVALDLEQVLLDPVLERGADVGLETGRVDPLLFRNAHEPQPLAPLDPVADDEIGQHALVVADP